MLTTKYLLRGNTRWATVGTFLLTFLALTFVLSTHTVSAQSTLADPQTTSPVDSASTAPAVQTQTSASDTTDTTDPKPTDNTPVTEATARADRAGDGDHTTNPSQPGGSHGNSSGGGHGNGDGNGDGNGHGNGHEEGEEEHESGPLEVATLNYEEIRDPLIFTIVVLLAGASKIGYHHADFLSSIIPESCILIILGTVFGAIIHFSGASESLPNFFEPHQFFIYLLPPIILEAAYSLHDRTVLENIGSILLFAVMGTVLASAFLGLTLYGLAEAGAMGSLPEVDFIQMMIFSSLIVAVDPVAVLAVFNEIGVNHVLYFMVFGESLLNDGVTVVLYKVFQSYNVMDEITAAHIVLGLIKFLVVCLGGLLLGVLAGIGTAVLTKFSTHVKVAQPIIIFTMAYFGFLLAEIFEFSGIISIIGCGLTQVQYAFNNISDKSRTTVKYFTKVISTCNEIIIFLFLGLSIVNDGHEWNTGFTLWTVVLCLAYRFIIIFAMSAMINRFDLNRVRLLSLPEQFMIAYGGLRGAVCFSLVALLSSNEVPAKSMFMTTTLVVILFTVFVQGISIKPLVSWLQISLAPEKSKSMYQELSSHVTDHVMAGMEEIIGEHGSNHLRAKIDRLDSKYLKPLLQVDPDPRDATLKVFYENLLLKEHYKFLKLSGAKMTDQMPEIPNMSADMLVSDLMGGDMMKRVDSDEFEDRPPRMSMPGGPNILVSRDPESDIVIRRRFTRSKSVKGADKRDIDAEGLRNLLMSQRDSKLILSRYDRNLTTPIGDVTKEIQRRKTKRNRRLERLLTETGSGATTPARSPVQDRKSWCEVESEVATERSRHPQGPRHAATINLGDSGIGRLGTVDPVTPDTLATQLNSVIEEEEGDTPRSSDGGKFSNGKKAAPKEEREEDEKHQKSGLHRQGGMDRTSLGQTGESATSEDPAANEHGEGDNKGIPLSDIRPSGESGGGAEKDSKV